MLNLLTHQAKVVFIWREEIRPDVLFQLTGIGPHRARNQTDHLIIKDITKSTVLCSATKIHETPSLPLLLNDSLKIISPIANNSSEVRHITSTFLLGMQEKPLRQVNDSPRPVPVLL